MLAVPPALLALSCLSIDRNTMKNALIDPNDTVNRIAGWFPNTNPPQPVVEQLPNSARVAEVADQTFPVAEPLFWIACTDDVVADQWYYDTDTQAIIVIPNPAPKPSAADQPIVTGAQTL